MQITGVYTSQIQSAVVPQPRLVQAAHEFEAQLMKELLRPMVHGSGSDESDGDSGGALADFATEAFGRSLSASGGLGIATSIVRSLSHSENGSQSDSKSTKETSTRPQNSNQPSSAARSCR